MDPGDAKMVALELLCQKFSELHDSALSEVPQHSQERISELESGLRVANLEILRLKKEVASIKADAEAMFVLVEAAKRWRKDRFSPRLERAIDAFSVEEIRNR